MFLEEIFLSAFTFMKAFSLLFKQNSIFPPNFIYSFDGIQIVANIIFCLKYKAHFFDRTFFHIRTQ